MRCSFSTSNCVRRCTHPFHVARPLPCLLKRCNELVQHIMAAPPDAAVVAMVDDISNTVSGST